MSSSIQATDLDNPNLFTHLISNYSFTAGTLHTLCLSSAPETPIVELRTSLSLPRSSLKPSITLLTSSAPQLTLGIAKLHKHNQASILGIATRPPIQNVDEGQTDQTYDPTIFHYESLHKAHKLDSKIYTFEYERMSGEGRKKYTWKRTQELMGHMMTMELREQGELRREEVMAVWKRKEKFFNVKSGDLWIRKWGEGQDWERWVVLVVLGWMAIAEAKRRK